jgi:hypothetical protein
VPAFGSIGGAVSGNRGAAMRLGKQNPRVHPGSINNREPQPRNSPPAVGERPAEAAQRPPRLPQSDVALRDTIHLPAAHWQSARATSSDPTERAAAVPGMKTLTLMLTFGRCRIKKSPTSEETRPQSRFWTHRCRRIQFSAVTNPTEIERPSPEDSIGRVGTSWVT